MENSQGEIVCSFCNSRVKSEDEVCSRCGSDLIEYDEGSEAFNKYPLLKSLPRICNFLVGAIIILTLISVLNEWTLFRGEIFGSFGTLLIIQSIIFGILSVVIIIAIGRGAKIMIDIESNSRVQTRLLSKLKK